MLSVTLLQDFSTPRLLEMLAAGLNTTLPIDILSVNSWNMQAQVAAAFDNGRDCNVFLVGDAAHRFPPAGGFGMNTGLQDAHNLAWKLAWVTGHKADKSLLRSYSGERRPVALANTEWSLNNYAKSAAAAAALGADSQHANMVVATAEKLPAPLAVKAGLVNAALKTGLYPLKFLRNWSDSVAGRLRQSQLSRLVDGGHSLPLIFPVEDLGFVYRTPGSRSCSASNAHYDSTLVVGGRAPHCWFTLGERTGQRLFASSVDFPAIAHAVVCADGVALPPPLLVFINCAGLQAAEEMIMRLGATTSTVLVVIQAVDNPVAHSALQTLWQKPHFTFPASAPHVPVEFSEADYTPLRSLSGARATECGVARRNDKGLWRIDVSDVTGRWAGWCAAGKVSAVVVRPDGHIAVILPTESTPNNSSSNPSEHMLSEVLQGLALKTNLE